MTSIRTIRPDDAKEVLAIYAPIVRDTYISFELETPSLEQMQSRISSISTEFPWIVAQSGDAVQGYAYASKHGERLAYQWSVNVSIYVAEEARGKGVGRTLYTTLFSILAELHYVKAFAGITLPNAASVRLHESLGFVPVGVYRNAGYKMGAWRDVGWWQRDLRPLPENPPPPIPMSSYKPLLRHER